jgi:tetratricopeptide (TPR) repeat protein
MGKKDKKKKVIQTDDRPLLELVMIIKNAESVIKDTLESVIPFIDHYTILDTGSKDKTVEIIRETLKNVSGNIYQEPFIDFSTSRNRALDLAGKKCKYTLFLDDTYHIYGGEELRKFISDKKEDAYNIKIYDLNDKKVYYSNRILSTNHNYRYKYRVHEVPDTKYPPINIKSENVFIKDCTDILTIKRSHARYSKDIEGLLLDLKDNPNDDRVLYYLGQTYLMLENYEEARKYLLKKIQKSRSPDEYLYLSYYDLALTSFRLDKDWKEVEEFLMKAYEIFPNRAEPLYKIASYYYRQGDIQTAWPLLQRAIKLPLPTNFNLEVDYDIYKYKVPYLYIETSMMLDIQKDPKNPKTKEILNLLDKMIEENPNNFGFQNIKEMINPSPLSDIIKFNNTKTIVIYTSFFENQIWDPKEFKNSYVSGSEIMARNMAIELVKIGYKVFLFGNFKNEKTDYQCDYLGVKFLDNGIYPVWIRKYYVNYLIVSRFSTNIIYLPNIENVYLWLHDVYPDYEFIQAHKTKFKGVWTLCNWHKRIVSKEYAIPDKMVKVTRNAIYTERFLNKNIEKVKNSFIWTSDPSRGLKYLLMMFPKIKTRIPDATLNIFCNQELLGEFEKEFISNNSEYIHLHPRKSQDEIALEFLKSDVWLYPTDFEETYCITAVEAQISRCLCLSVDIGSLSEILDDRGITVKGKINEESTQNNLLEYLYLIMEDEDLKTTFLDNAYNWAIEQDYSSLAKEWQSHFF